MNKNLVIFIVASLGIYGGWAWWMHKNYPPLPAGSLAAQKSGTPAVSSSVAPSALPLKAAPKKAPAKEQLSAVATESMEVELTNLGAKIRSLKLRSYREHPGKPDAVQLVSVNGDYGAFEISGASLSSDAWTPETPRPVMGADGSKQMAYRIQVAGSPISVRKTFSFSPTGFVIKTKIEVMNAGKEDKSVAKSYLLWGPNLGLAEGWKRDEPNTGGSVQMEGKFERLSLGDAKSEIFQAPKWVAVKNHYFVAAYINDNGAFPEAELRRGLYEGVTKSVTAALGLGEMVVKAGESKAFEARLYAGPQDYGILKSFGNNLNAVIQFSFQWISPLSVFLLQVLKALHAVTQNWGFAVIFLTLLVKLALFYPTHRGMVSSRRMQTQMAKMAPVLESLKKTYKDDAAQLQKETMRLYKEHGVNPLSGCFLMLPQMFIMISLYGALNGTFELRGASFLGPWTDLSAPDPTYILVPLMGASMWLQQKMTPVNTATMTEEQAQMQKMMQTMMPLMFTVMGFIFRWPTGLLLYWTVSNAFGIGQQWYVNKNVK
jgi:YidC/Oxa1 family membrane protein insertase